MSNIKKKPDNKPKRIRRKKGAHRMNYDTTYGYPRCSTCGMDEDQAFTAGDPCTYGHRHG